MRLFMDHKASPDWAVRRRIIILSLMWEAALFTVIVAWAMAFAVTNPLLDVALINLASLFGGTVGSYIFGAVWDRKNERKADVAQTAVETSGTTTNVTVEQ
jgi:uncharacterized membrane protein